MRYAQGVARYQNRDGGDAGINVRVLTEDLTLLSQTQTDSAGIYSLPVPDHDIYWLIYEVQGYRTEKLFLLPEDLIPEVIMQAGDLNNDGCINFDDMHILSVRDQLADPLLSDFNGDGGTNVADVAMLAGNIDSSCQIRLSTTATPPPPEVTPELGVTPTVVETMIAIETPIPLNMISGTELITTIEAEITEEP